MSKKLVMVMVTMIDVVTFFLFFLVYFGSCCVSLSKACTLVVLSHNYGAIVLTRGEMWWKKP